VDNRFGVNVVFRCPEEDRLEAAAHLVQAQLTARNIASDVPDEDDAS
jgi:hypothetical protein